MRITKSNQEKNKKENYKKILKRVKKEVKAITLIALVVTIIVMLILAGITLNLTIGNNGLFKRAQNAVDTYEGASEKEAIEMLLAANFIDSVSGKQISKEELEETLKNQFGDKINVEDNGDGSFLVTIDENQYYLGEDGELIDSTNMVKISTADELKTFRDDVNSGNTYEGKYVYITDDITLNSSEEWEPIGYYSQDTGALKLVLENEKNKPFSGTFDGKNHTINNMYINNNNNVQGFFGLVIDGNIKNINIAENCSINAGGSSGSVVGYMYNTGRINNCKNYADLNRVGGGIVGHVAGSITVSNCINYGDIQNGSGGIIDSSNGTDWEEFANVQHTIMNCANYGSITSTIDQDYVGGIVGFFKGNILNSFNLGNIENKGSSSQNWTGGIAGEIYGNAENCYNIADINGVYCTGGIAGVLTGYIMNCYSIANISGGYEIGDIFGYVTNDDDSEIVNCYSKKDSFNAGNLGNTYVDDTENINQGYPILKWQKNN